MPRTPTAGRAPLLAPWPGRSAAPPHSYRTAQRVTVPPHARTCERVPV